MLFTLGAVANQFNNIFQVYQVYFLVVFCECTIGFVYVYIFQDSCISLYSCIVLNNPYFL